MAGVDDDPPRRRPRVDRAALASNWRQVLAADAAVGLAVVVVGVVVLVVVSVLVGALVMGAGAAYVTGGMFRWRRWARLRAEAGLDQPEADRPE